MDSINLSGNFCVEQLLEPREQTEYRREDKMSSSQNVTKCVGEGGGLKSGLFYIRILCYVFSNSL